MSFGVQIPAAAACLLSLWSQVSRAQAFPGVLSIPEVRGGKQCSAPYMRAQGGTAEECRLLWPGKCSEWFGWSEPGQLPSHPVVIPSAACCNPQCFTIQFTLQRPRLGRQTRRKQALLKKTVKCFLAGYMSEGDHCRQRSISWGETARRESILGGVSFCCWNSWQSPSSFWYDEHLGVGVNVWRLPPTWPRRTHQFGPVKDYCGRWLEGKKKLKNASVANNYTLSTLVFVGL